VIESEIRLPDFAGRPVVMSNARLPVSEGASVHTSLSDTGGAGKAIPAFPDTVQGPSVLLSNKPGRKAGF